MFLVLSYSHLYSMVKNYGVNDINFTILMMNQTTKVSYLAWAVYDYYSEDNSEKSLKKEVDNVKIDSLPTQCTLIKEILLNVKIKL